MRPGRPGRSWRRQASGAPPLFGVTSTCRATSGLAYNIFSRLTWTRHRATSSAIRVRTFMRRGPFTGRPVRLSLGLRDSRALPLIPFRGDGYLRLIAKVQRGRTRICAGSSGILLSPRPIGRSFSPRKEKAYCLIVAARGHPSG